MPKWDHGRGGAAGRKPEEDAIAELLAGAPAGTSSSLVLRGEPGIGKTALLDHAAAAAGDMRLVRGTGVEFEAELPFSGLQLLLRPALGSLAALPGPQREALEAAFGLGPAAGSEPMLVGLAVLSLLAEHADETGLLCLVDDAQWLDRASRDALLFAARRLHAEGVVMIFAARDGEGSFPAPGFPELRLSGLAPEAAAALLDRHPLAPAVRYRLLAEAGGNPLALLELPVALAAEGGSAFSPGAPPTSRLQLAFHGQVSRMPEACQSLLLVAAADETGELAVILRAAAALGAAVEDLSPAERAGLVLRGDADGTTIRFRSSSDPRRRLPPGAARATPRRPPRARRRPRLARARRPPGLASGGRRHRSRRGGRRRAGTHRRPRPRPQRPRGGLGGVRTGRPPEHRARRQGSPRGPGGGGGAGGG